MSAPLLGAEFLRELEILKRSLEIQARSGAAGERAAARRGGSAEFQEHRPYEPGDDLRRIDWLAFARTGQPVTKLFRAEEDAVVRLLLDASASLDYGSPTKLETAQRIAAAAGYLALSSGQRAELFVARSASGSNQALTRSSRARRGRAAVAALLREISHVGAGGTTNLAAALRAIVENGLRPGLIVLISDFLDAGPVLSALGQVRAAGHDVALVHVLDPSEIDPSFEGDLSLVDAESGASVEVTADAAAIEAYLLRIAGLIEELRNFARRRGGSYVRTTTGEDLTLVMCRFVARSVD